MLENMEEFKFDLYLPAEGTLHPSDSNTFDLYTTIQEFLSGDTYHKVCLIQGPAGAGKSTFSRHMARLLWNSYESSNETTAVIPLFISLAGLHDPQAQQDLISAYFRNRGFSDEEIRLAQRTRRFIFILDGYDEISKRDRNFYQENKLDNWTAQVVISTRPDYLSPGYQSKFYPRSQPRLFREYWLAPFSIEKIRTYIKKYIATKGTEYSVEG